MSIFSKVFGNISKGYETDQLRKVVIIRGFSYLTMFALFVFSIIRYRDGEIQATIIDSTIFFVILLNFLYHIYTKKVTLPSFVTVSLIFILFLAIFLIIGKGGTGLYWYYCFPIITIFLIGNKWGTTFSMLLLAVTVYLLIYPPEFAIKYPKDALLRFPFTYLLVMGATAFYEYVRHKTRLAFLKMHAEKSEYLEETIQQKEEILLINETLTEDKNLILKQRDEIEKAHEHIKSSIRYAKGIQDSLITKDELIKKFIPGNFFIYFKPKEVVSGDFYYVNKTEKYLNFAVADCTGHGVAGGFISMLAITHLHRILTDTDHDMPGVSLDKLRERIKGNFASFGSNSKNGLDIALCSVNLETNELRYSGAYNPIVIFRNNEPIEFKPTKNPIGFYPKEVNFETKSFILKKGDVIYLFSDGYQDQMGGKGNRKFSKSKLITLFKETHKYPMEKQKTIIENIMKKWMGENTQLDDITVMGINWNN